MSCVRDAFRKGETEGLKNALAIVGDLSARTIGSGMLTDTFRKAYEIVESELLAKIRLAEVVAEQSGTEGKP